MKKLFDYLSKFGYLLYIDLAFLMWYFKNNTYGQFDTSERFGPIGDLLKVFLVLFLIAFLTGNIGKLVLFIKEMRQEKKAKKVAIENDNDKEQE